MSQINVLTDLQQRDLIAQVTDESELAQLLACEEVRPYAGFDPTADSLHIGSLVPLLSLRRFQMAGHRPIAVVGGATGLIGDPSFKASERGLNDRDIVEKWTESLRTQIKPFLDFEGAHPATVVNNHAWLGPMQLLPFLRDIGKHFRINTMIAKDSVRQRLDREESGLSLTEFSYSPLQAYDFVHLKRQYDCRLQLGGSDQWGNITAGIELGRRLDRVKLYGLTLPLITRTDGTKFGKTEAGTVWLDGKKTSPYAFHQYWLSVSDKDVYRFLKQFTFLPVATIQEIEEEDAASLTSPKAQGVLADEVTSLVHGPDACKSAKRIADCLFNGDPREMSKNDLDQLALDGLPCMRVRPSEISAALDALVLSGLAKSKTEGRQFMDSGSIRINGEVLRATTTSLGPDNRLQGTYTLLQRGKKQHAMLHWV